MNILQNLKESDPVISNFIIHCMIFTAIISGTWLLKEIKYEISYFNNFAIVWSVLLASHLLYVIIKKPKDTSKQST